MELIHLSSLASGRKLEDMAMNELRAILYKQGIEYANTATKAELIKLIQDNR